MFASFRPLLARAPHGDGHPVLVLPGMGATDRSTAPMRGFLAGLGYQVHGWRLGRNMPTPVVIDALRNRFAELYQRHGGVPMSLVGWSLGGIYAREIAAIRPDTVREVITLGSPFQDVPGEESHPAALIRALRPDLARRRGVNRPGQGPLRIPSTAIFSRTDGIVPWRAARNIDGPFAESIEVVSSHVGLGHHPGVLWAVADRLAQPAGGWRPFVPDGAWARLFPSHRS